MQHNQVLVTGASGLLGREVAKLFARSNYKVAKTAHSRADGVDILKLDLGDSSSVKQVLDQVKY